MLIDGVYTAIATPYSANGDVDLDGIAPLIDRIVDGGGQGIVVLGTTGEGYAADDRERADILRIAADAAAGRVKLIAGATASTSKATAAYAQLASELDYQAAMIAPPPYVIPSPQELAHHYREVVRQTDIPVLMYDYPARTGLTIGWEVLDALSDVPEIIGLKESSGDFERIIEMRHRYNDRYEIVCGADSLIIDFAIWGSRGWIAGASGFLTAAHVELLRAAASGDLPVAKQMLTGLLPLFLELERGGYTQKVRYGLELHGHTIGAPRLPLHALPDEEREVLRAAITRAKEEVLTTA